MTDEPHPSRAACQEPASRPNGMAVATERTPNTSTVRTAWMVGHPFPHTTDPDERLAEFDRWLAKHDGELRASVAAQVRALAASYEHDDRPGDHPTACIYEVLMEAVRVAAGDAGWGRDMDQHIEQMRQDPVAYVEEARRRAMGDDRLTETCTACQSSIDVPNKWMGRARLAAWRSRHQRHEAQ